MLNRGRVQRPIIFDITYKSRAVRLPLSPRGSYAFLEVEMGTQSKWRQESAAAIQEALRSLPADASLADKVRAIDAAYPFGERAHHPYRMWLKERKAVVDSLGHGGTGDKNRDKLRAMIESGRTVVELPPSMRSKDV